MGCCGSVPTVPKTIISDPGEEEGCVFSLKKCGMMSRNYNVYKGSECLEENRWLFLRKKGKWLSGDCVLEIENFIRDDHKKGQVLWSAKFDTSPNFNTSFDGGGWGGWDFTSFGFQSLTPNYATHDSSYYFGLGNMRMGSSTMTARWQLQTSAHILPGTRGQKYGDNGFTLHVYAVGTSVASYYLEHDDHDGHDEWKHDTTDYVDLIMYKLVQNNINTVICEWQLQGLQADPYSDIQLDIPIFHLTIQGGWSKWRPIITSKEPFDPIFGLVLGFLCAREYSPKEITGDLHINWPQLPS